MDIERKTNVALISTRKAGGGVEINFHTFSAPALNGIVGYTREL